MLETKGWNQPDHSLRWIAAGYGSWPDMDGWKGIDHRGLIPGDGSLATDDNQSPSILWRYWGYVKWYLSRGHFDFKRRCYHRAWRCRHMMYQRQFSTKYDTKHCSETPTMIPTEPCWSRVAQRRCWIATSGSWMSKVRSQMTSPLSFGDPDTVSTMPRYTAPTGNQHQNQS